MSLQTLIWLFPIAFMFHDFEELLLGEAWLRKNAPDLRARLQNRLPPALFRQIDAVFGKSTAELAFPISLIFALTALSAVLANLTGSYGFFLIAASSFFLHGFMHIGQAVLLRRYVPAALTSAFIAVPYGIVLFTNLIAGRVVSPLGLLVYFLFAVLLTVPFILVMHAAGDLLYKITLRLLVER